MISEEEVINMIEQRIKSIFSDSLVTKLELKPRSDDGIIRFECFIVSRRNFNRIDKINGFVSAGTGYTLISAINNMSLNNMFFI